MTRATGGPVSAVEEGEDRSRGGELIVSLLFTRDVGHESPERRSVQQCVLIHRPSATELSIPERKAVTLVYGRVAGHVNGRQNVDFDIVEICHGIPSGVDIAPRHERRFANRLTVDQGKRFGRFDLGDGCYRSNDRSLDGTSKADTLGGLNSIGLIQHSMDPFCGRWRRFIAHHNYYNRT